MTQRNAQLVIAREYGFAGWRELSAEVSKRLGNGLEWAAAEAARIIHDNDVEGLKQLLTEYPTLLSWRGDNIEAECGLMGIATSSYGDSFNSFSEQHFTRAACAELLIDAGAVVLPSVCEGVLNSRARGLLQLFQRKGLLPRTLKFFAALGDIDAVRQVAQALEVLPERAQERIQGDTDAARTSYALAVYLFAPLAVVVPLTISTAVGASTIVGERERGTGEFLAHSPATVREIYLGKLLASLLPGYVTTVVGFGVYSLVVNLIVDLLWSEWRDSHG